MNPTSTAHASAIDCLFRPLALRGITLPNRVVMAPMTRGFCPGGIPGPDVAAYYRRRAEGGVGLIVTEGIGVDHPSSLGYGGLPEGEVPVLHGDQAIAGWRAVVAAVHAAGGVIIPQLWHQGVIREPFTGRHPAAESMRPSGIWGPVGVSPLDPAYIERVSIPTRPMSESDIADIIAAFARSACNAAAAGFDGIALHAAHGYLIDTFLWDKTNLRTDAYGGSPEHRARFGAELVRAIRAEIGPDLPIVLRYSQWKQQDFNATLSDTPEGLGRHLAPLADAGVDVFDASTRYFQRPAFPGSALTLAGWTKKLIGLPSIAVGNVGLKRDLFESLQGGGSEPEDLTPLLERLANDEFDLVGVGRSLIADPNWVRKVERRQAFDPFSAQSLMTLA